MRAITSKSIKTAVATAAVMAMTAASASAVTVQDATTHTPYTGGVTGTLTSATVALDSPSGEHGECTSGSGAGSITTANPAAGTLTSLSFAGTSGPSGNLCDTNLTGAPYATVTTLGLPWGVAPSSTTRFGLTGVDVRFDLFDAGGTSVGKCTYRNTGTLGGNWSNANSSATFLGLADTAAKLTKYGTGNYAFCPATANLSGTVQLLTSGGNPLELV